MSTWAILLAGGSGSRLAAATGGVKKQFLQYQGRPLFWHSLTTFAAMPAIHGLVLVFPEQDLATAQALFAEHAQELPPGVPVLWACGGASRQDSSANGLAALPPQCDRVLVHDTARPFVSPLLAQRVLDGLSCGDAVVPGLPVTDTIKQVQGEAVTATIPRFELRAVQTPQGFHTPILRRAHTQAATAGHTVTDDAAMVEYAGGRVTLVPGEPENRKITTAEDLAMLTPAAPSHRPCTGWGYDVHRFGPGRPMKLGGVPITNGPEVQAHSDGDVLLHAVIDALLGCLGQGDIGEHFPDTDASLDNANSGALLTDVLDWCRYQGLTLHHVDMTLICQTPKIGPWKQQIRRCVAALLGLPVEQCNLKATTEEGLGFTGRREGIKAVVVVSGETPAP
ncbi:MAG: 2-C-methyl-D-erythritol 4-phosphate cytidylyltransferase [Thermodesulfobacteriota bacterium]